MRPTGWPSTWRRPPVGADSGQFPAALRVWRWLALSIASTSSRLFIDERPGTSSRFATSYRCSLVALASTPPWVGVLEARALGPLLAAWASDGPLPSLGSQWSPTFS